MKNHLEKECNRIIDNAEHTALAHYIVAARYKTYTYVFEIIPAVLSAISGSLILADIISDQYILFTAITATVTAVGAVLNPKKIQHDNLHAAKSFTLIKNDAKNLLNVFHDSDDKGVVQKISNLHEKYQQLISLTPETEKWAYEKARRKLC